MGLSKEGKGKKKRKKSQDSKVHHLAKRTKEKSP